LMLGAFRDAGARSCRTKYSRGGAEVREERKKERKKNTLSPCGRG